MLGIKDYRKYHKNSQNQEFNSEVPTSFIENPWKKALYNKLNQINRKAWEIGLF